MYNNYSDWNAGEGKRILQKLVKKYKLLLISYETNKVFFNRTVNSWSKYKLTCEYTIPSSLLKFNLNIFYYSKNYIIKKGNITSLKSFKWSSCATF